MQEGRTTSSKCTKKPFENPITRQDVEIAARRALGADLKISSYRVQDYSEEKLGFLGAHRNLVVDYRRHGSEETKTASFFVKSMPYDIEEQAFVIEDSRAFFKETHFYSLIVPELTSSVKDTSWLARCYLVKDDAMVFEDLKSRRFGLKGHFLDYQGLKSALTAMANLHASSLLAEKRLGKALNELYPELMTEGQFGRNIRFYDWFRVSVDALVAAAKHLGLAADRIPEICDRIFDKLVASNKWPNLLCHGDLKAYNMMFDDTKPLSKCVLIDFQLIRYCPATTDILQMIYLASRRELRDKYEVDLLKHYHRSLCTVLKENGEEIKLPKFEKLQQEYEEMRVVGVVTASLFFQIMLLEGKRCAELAKDSDGYAKLYFKDRKNLVLDTMKDDQSYSEIMTEITMEMIERSERLLIS